MKNLNIIVTFFLLSACVSKNNNHDNRNTDSAEVAKSKKNSNVIVDDPSLFPRAFVDSLRTANYSEVIRLEKNYLIVGIDTTYFPANLKKDKVYYFTAKKDSAEYELSVKRLNVTDIEFDYKLTTKNSVLFHEKGLCRLQPLFFLGSESPTDDESGDSYLADEYINVDGDANIFAIDIESDIEGDKDLMSIVKGSNKKFADVTLRMR